ncbi:Kinesin protein [Fasciola hepatica]|uniref:Kinesin protein n=1 Tax=Fasciola hepatica TaxID=6192 RepID=A0A2H1BTK1_FASHE|nr:Kinesin protein [Fasciola hepatica]
MSANLVKSLTSPSNTLNAEITSVCGGSYVISDSGIRSNVLQFPSEGTELWIDEQQELFCDRMMDRAGECSRSVPPSPTHGLRSKRVGRLLYCSTPAGRGRGIIANSRGQVSIRSSETNKSDSSHRNDDHNKECEHGLECNCYLSDSRCSITNSQSATASTRTGTEAADEQEASELSHASRTGSVVSLTRDHGRSVTNNGRKEVSERVRSQHRNDHKCPGPSEGTRRSESYTAVHNRSRSPPHTSSSRPPRAQTHDRLTKLETMNPVNDDYRNGWPAPIPFRFGLSSHATNQLTMDTISVFKYRIHYPNLMQWSYRFIRSYAKWQREGVIPPIASHSSQTESNNFVNEVLKKRAQKDKQIIKSNENYTKFHDSKPVSLTTTATTPSYALKNQLWKRRYYSLLNAVDFVYKDYQLLHYVSKESLFSFVSTPPVLPSNTVRSPGKYISNVWPVHAKDIQNLATVGADPAGYLSERITQVLVKRSNAEVENIEASFTWPCLFHISVAFLSDVMAQSRILRCDLDRRLAVYDRLIYVLSQAREQRAKLKVHMSRQRELLDSLTCNLCAIQKRFIGQSPPLDRPASVRDGLASDITSPFVECENVESERHHRLTKQNDQIKDAGRQPTGSDWNNTDYVQRRTEIYTEISNLERVLREEEVRRKRLHNRIQELTGNIRVFCRLRPDDNPHSGFFTEDDERGRYLRVSSNDKLLFCPDTLKDQIQERKSTIPFAYHGTRTLMSGPVPIGPVATPICGSSGAGNSYTTWNGAPKCFIFDRVFGPRATQAEVYREVDDLIVSCIDGYNVCIMAYGQTGSGKTYTMMGTEEEPGVNRRAVRSLFERCGRRKHWKYSIFVSIVEIYQEDVFDLLEDVDESVERGTGANNTPIQSQPSPTPGRARRKSGRDSSKWKQPLNQSAVPWNTWTGRGPPTYSTGLSYFTGKPLRRRGSVRILSDQLDGVVLQNLHERSVHDENEMLHYLHLAEKQRRVGSTRLNICSSRSHLVILLRVIGEHQFQMTTSRGTLTLADLAGSENVTKSGSTGERFLEAACINKSLSSLGRVFDALRRQQKPTYRETKLTYLLRPTLSGESKCLLFVALRTEPEHAEETWRAIHFGQGALQVVPGGGNGGGVSIPGVGNTVGDSDAPVDKLTGPESGPATFTYKPSGLTSPNALLHSIRSGASHRAKSRGKPKINARNSSSSNIVSFLPQSVYSMGPAITKRGWR